MKGHNHHWRRYVLTLVILAVIAYCQSLNNVKIEPVEKEPERCPTSIHDSKLSISAFFDNLYTSTKNQTSCLSNLTNKCILTVSHYLLKCAPVFLSFVIATSVLVVCEPSSLSKECKEVTCNQKSISARKSCLSLDFMSAGLEILDAILVTSREIKKQKSCLKDDSWMYEPERYWMANVTEYFVYPVFHLLASYVPLSRSGSYNCKYSLTEMAEAGFMYTGEGEMVRCTGCGQTIELSYITSDPKSSACHRDTCRFSKGNESANKGGYNSNEMEMDASAEIVEIDGGFEESVSGDSKGEEGAGALADPPPPNEGMAHQNIADVRPGNPAEDTGNPTTGASSGLAGASTVPLEGLLSVSSAGGPVTETQLGCNERQTAEAGPHRQPTAVRPGIQRSNPNNSGNSNSSADSGNSSVFGATADSSSWGQGARSKDPRSKSYHHPDVDHGGFYDENAYRMESMTQKPNLKEELYKKSCEKNQGHFAHFLIKDLKMEFLPTGVRHAHFLRAVELMARLTVRIIVKKLSTKRSSSSEGEPAKYIIGTGSCLETAAIKLAPNEHDGFQRKWTSVKKYLPFHRKKYGEIYVETNSHVVFDDVEAENTTIEFYFDRLNRKDVVKVKGVAVRHSDQPGVYKCQLICHTEDLELVDRLNRDREEFWNLVNNPPADIHEALFRRVFVVGHPHGGEKILACGKSVVMKYMLISQKQSNRTVLGLKKITHSEKLPYDARNSVRKVMIFTTDTCIGMSGAPILSFKMTRDSGDGENGPVKVEPELWMHNGVDIKHDLAGSVMQALTEEDIAEHGRPNKPARPAVNENAGDGTNSFKTKATGPVFTVMGHPSHPSYIAFEKRLDSFRYTWSAELERIQSGQYLAEAGFFFAGYTDCARCFQCGLGLRGWKEGDDVYLEHFKYKPTCPFLVNKLRAQGITDPETEFRRRQQNSGRANNETGNETSNGESRIPQTELSVRPHTASGQSTASACMAGVMSFVENFPKPCMPQRLEKTATSGSGDQTSMQSLGSSQQRLILLQKENEILQKQLLCRVCFKNPVKDLFLPCGELYACTDCSKLLSTCPSCLKPIKATVTTYFT